MPRGFLKKLMVSSECRGRDSTGVAWREGESNLIYKQIGSATRFVHENKDILKRCRKSTIGIGHTRRASPGMPVNNRNAHPFSWGPYVYAHNGVVRNWKIHRDRLVEIANGNDNKAAVAEFESWSVDSLVIGSRLESLDFTNFVGAWAIPWLFKDQVYVTRHGKELTGINLLWKYLDDPENAPERKLSFAASTVDIAADALNDCKHFEFEFEIVELDEDVAYHVTPDGFDPVKKVLVDAVAIVDEWSSGKAVDEKGDGS